ncbi:MAG: GntR family transcriptional regulator [Luteitalea sp.]|nr:GntR family transcriptional regulator [Luteitalea sp.]
MTEIAPSKRTQRLSGEQIQRDLGRMLMALPTDERLPTVRELAGSLGASIGSVQAALTRLEEAAAIAVERHGRMGTFLRWRSLGHLWSVVEDLPMVVAFPLPTSRRIEGLATAIRSEVLASKIETFSIFIRGSRKRMQALRQGRCHVAAMSSFAAHELCSAEEEIAVELAEGTFVSKHVVLESEVSSPGRLLRVAVDPSSVDQQKISEMEFAKRPVQFVSVPYMQLSTFIEQGRADCAVWSVDEMTERRPARIRDRPLSGSVLSRLAGADLRTALVVRSADTSTKTVIGNLTLAMLQEIQADVVAGRIVPEY